MRNEVHLFGMLSLGELGGLWHTLCLRAYYMCMGAVGSRPSANDRAVIYTCDQIVDLSHEACVRESILAID